MYSGFGEPTNAVYEQVTRLKELSPRIRMALRLYGTSAVPTLQEAADAAGINYTYLTIVMNSPIGVAFMNTLDQRLEDKTLETSAIIDRLSKRALTVIEQIMEDGKIEGIRLKAAIDLADRGPETSKIQKHQVESFSLTGSDAQMIAEALAQGRTVKEVFGHVADQGFDRVAIDSPRTDSQLQLFPDED